MSPCCCAKCFVHKVCNVNRVSGCFQRTEPSAVTPTGPLLRTPAGSPTLTHLPQAGPSSLSTPPAVAHPLGITADTVILNAMARDIAAQPMQDLQLLSGPYWKKDRLVVPNVPCVSSALM